MMIILQLNPYGAVLPEERAVHIQLFDDTMSIMLESSREDDPFTPIQGVDRYTVSGYGTVYLHRKFNQTFITSDVDPIYGESVNLAIAMAIHMSQHIDCAYGTLPERSANFPGQRKSQEMPVEVWRILSAAKVLFAGISENFDTGSIESYVDLLSYTPLNQNCLPESCTGFLEKIQVGLAQSFQPGSPYFSSIDELAIVIILLAHVTDIEACTEMPICVTSEGRGEIKSLMKQASRDPKLRIKLSSPMIFDGIFSLLSSDPNVGPNLPFLRCDLGWSIFLDTIGDKDPANVRRDLIHIQKGIPTDTRTNEQKNHLRDGPVKAVNIYSSTGHIVRESPSGKCLPRTAATIQRRTEYWNSRVNDFELLIYFQINQTPEWRQYIDIGSFKEYTGCRQMHDFLWHTVSSIPCDHEQDIVPAPILLGSSAVAVLGWNIDIKREKEAPEKIHVYLTRGEPGIRWLAVKDAVNYYSDSCGVFLAPEPRNVMLRTNECCDKCALDQTAARARKWILIL